MRDLVSAGYTGNKGAGGFYRGSPDAREVVDLQTGELRPMVRSEVEAALVGERDGLRALAEHPSPAGRFARRVLAHALGYAASLVPEVSDETAPIDEAMKLGLWLVPRAVRDDRLRLGQAGSGISSPPRSFRFHRCSVPSATPRSIA